MTKRFERKLQALEHHLGWRLWKHLSLAKWPYSALLSFEKDRKWVLDELSTPQLEELLAALSQDEQHCLAGVGLASMR